MIPRPAPDDSGIATGDDGIRIAWKRYGTGEPAILFVPTWNLVERVNQLLLAFLLGRRT
jgi:hypothetical protein